MLCPNEPAIQQDPPHVDGHDGEEVVKGEIELVRSITHLLDHTERHVWTLSQIHHPSSSNNDARM
jgi:hypothetical protein